MGLDVEVYTWSSTVEPLDPASKRIRALWNAENSHDLYRIFIRIGSFSQEKRRKQESFLCFNGGLIRGYLPCVVSLSIPTSPWITSHPKKFMEVPKFFIDLAWVQITLYFIEFALYLGYILTFFFKKMDL